MELRRLLRRVHVDLGVEALDLAPPQGVQLLFVQQQLRVQRGRWPWRQPKSVAEHHEVRKQCPERCWLLESDTDAQQVTHVQQRQLWGLEPMERVLGKLRL